MNFANARKAGALLAALLIAAVPLLHSIPVNAGDLLNRRLELGSSLPNETTRHTFTFDIPSPDAVGSIAFEYCGNGPLFADPCGALNGFDASSATLANQSGETGFSIHNSSTINRVVLTRTAVPVTPGQVSYELTNVTNPNMANKSFYVRLATYASADGTGPRIDDGGLASSTAQLINVNAYVPPYLEFCVGIVIFNNDCSTADGNLINFGTLTSDTTKTGTSKMQAATNAPGGYIIQVDGTTMAAGNNVIPAMQPPAGSDLGTSQFGMNLRANTNPNVGLEPSGPGTAQPTSSYNTPNTFTFNSGDTIASSSVPNDKVTFTASYIINVSPEQDKGRYSTTLTYICTGSF